MIGREKVHRLPNAFEYFYKARHSDSRMDTSVRVFSLSVFFVVVCTIFIFAVFLWAPEHLCDHGLDLGDQLIYV